MVLLNATDGLSQALSKEGWAIPALLLIITLIGSALIWIAVWYLKRREKRDDDRDIHQAAMVTTMTDLRLSTTGLSGNINNLHGWLESTTKDHKLLASKVGLQGERISATEAKIETMEHKTRGRRTQ